MKLKAILSLILCAAIITGTLAMPASAKAYSAPSPSYALGSDEFVVEDGVLVNYTGNGGDISIPSGITCIGYRAFAGNEKITGVIIPNTVTEIVDLAFSDCEKLVSVTIPTSVTSIGEMAFDGTPWLKNLTGPLVVVGDGILLLYKGKAPSVLIPDTIKSIGAGAFEDNTTLEEVSFPSTGLTKICDMAFSGCEKLTSITIPACVTSIGREAFSGCYDLETITIPATVTSIGYGAFNDTVWFEDYTGFFVIAGDGILLAYTGSATTVTVPDGVKRIGENAFGYYSGDYDSGVKTIALPNSVIKICFAAFSDCYDLTTINIPVNVVSIEDYAFAGCESLTGITIPASVTSIGDAVFMSCSSLAAITVDAGNTAYSSQDGVLFNRDKAELILCPCAKEGSYAVPDTVKSIDDGAFYECSGLTGVTIPNGVTEIGFDAFGCCEGLTSLTVPQSVTSIDDYAFECCYLLTAIVINGSITEISDDLFYGCESLTSVTLPDTVTSIGYDAFDGCVSLTGIALPAGLTTIDDDAFWGCEKLANITLPAGLKTIGEMAFSGCEKLANVTIPNGVTSIGSWAFEYCSAFTSASIPASVTKIGIEPFGDCPKLTQINVDAANANYASRGGVLFNKDFTTLVEYPCGIQGSYSIPATVKTIGDYAFYDCEKLTGITIPVGVTVIGESSFEACYGLKSVVIPKSVTTIGDRAFYGFDMYEEEPSGLANITIPSTVTKIGSQAFDGTAWLENNPNDFVVAGAGFLLRYNGTASSVIIPGNVKYIGEYTFAGSESITNVFIPGSVLSVGDSAFFYCDSLKTVTISKGVTSIGSEAFAACSSLTSVYIPASVTKIGFGAFESYYYEGSIKLYGIAGSYAQTYAADNDIPFVIITPVTAIKLGATTLTNVPGKSQKLTLTVTPANATNKTVIWSSDNSKVATVDSYGTVKTVSVGKAIITCIAKDGSGIKATCTVNVVPATPVNFKAVSASYNSIKLSWSAVSGATGYAVYRYNSGTKKWDKIKVTTATSFTDTPVTIDKNYYYIVKAYKTVGGTDYYSINSVTVCGKALPSVPGSFKAARASSTSIKVSWAAVTGASGYEVWRWSNATEKYEKIKTISALSYTNAGLKKNCSYSYKVRAYKTVAGVNHYGAFTAPKAAKTY